MKKLIALVFASTVAAAASAAPETYVMDPLHTFSRFEYSHFGYSTQVNKFNSTQGKIQIARSAHTGSVEVTIDPKSVNTGSELFNGHLQGPDFFDSEKYPAITYKSTRFNFKGDSLASVDGQLTIKGVTRPVTLEVTSFHCMPHPMMKKDACGANAVAKIKRSEFGAGKYAPHVSDEVVLGFSIEAVKE